MAKEYIEGESDANMDDADEYAALDNDVVYFNYCKRMFKDFKTQRMYENTEK